MKTKNISYLEILEFVENDYWLKNILLKGILSYETNTHNSRNDLYFNIFNDSISFSIDPLFELPGQVGKYIETGEL